MDLYEKYLFHLNSSVRICSDDDTLQVTFNLLKVLGILGMFFYFSYSISVQRVLWLARLQFDTK